MILTPGGVVTVDQTRVSLAPEATAVVLGTSTVPLAGTSVGLPDRSDDGDGDDDGDGVDDGNDDDDDDGTSKITNADASEGDIFNDAVGVRAKSTECLFGLKILVAVVIVLALL